MTPLAFADLFSVAGLMIVHPYMKITELYQGGGHSAVRGQLLQRPHHSPTLPHQNGSSRQLYRVKARRLDTCRVTAAASSARSVKILLQGRQVTVTESIDAYVREKVSKVTAKYESGIRKVDVKLSVRGGDRGVGPKEHLAEVTIFTLRNGVVRVEDYEDNMYASIDIVCDKIARKMSRVKDHAIAVGKWQGSARGQQDAKIADQTMSLDDDDEDNADEDNGEEYGTPLPDNFDAFDSARAPVTNPPPDLLRQKEFYLTPMTLTEAILSLDQVGHDFYIFQEQETGQVQVVYRRKEEGYGVIIPHLAPPA